MILFTSCSNYIVSSDNEKFGKLHSKANLVIKGEKKFLLDDYTAPRIPYIQMIKDSLGRDILTFLNSYNNSIYFFDYHRTIFQKKIQFEKEGPNGILSIAGYYIINNDSIFLYNRPMVELVLASSANVVKQRISLKGVGEEWPLHYPQYSFNTLCPILKKDNNLILTGLCPFSLESSKMNNFHFSTYLNLFDNTLEYYHTYPIELYGNNANWEDPLFMQVYPAISPEGNIIHSFPVSHNIYISKFKSAEKNPIYAGSNIAGAISSIDWNFIEQRTPRNLIYSHYLKQDLYGGILYDKWRKVYYRFMEKGLNDATTRSQLNEKQVSIVCMDENFAYIGEKELGKTKEWNWTNSFVTEEGLNIEYVDMNDVDEKFLIFKIIVFE